MGTGGIRDNKRYQQESQKKASKVIDERSMDRAKGMITLRLTFYKLS